MVRPLSVLTLILLFVSCDGSPNESRPSGKPFMEGRWVGVAQYLDDTVHLNLQQDEDSVFGRIEVGRTFTWPTPEIDGKVSGRIVDKIDEKIRLTAWPDTLSIEEAKSKFLTLSITLTPDKDKDVMRGSYNGWDLRMERE